MIDQVKIRLTNSLATPRVVVLEPWAGEYTLAPGRNFDILAEGDLSLPLEVEFTDDRVIIYAADSEGAMLRIFSDGIEILRSE